MDVEIAGIRFETPLLNASGVLCHTYDELALLADTRLGALVTKTQTYEAREGNPLPRFAETEYCTINSSGLPNLGYKGYLTSRNWENLSSSL